MKNILRVILLCIVVVSFSTCKKIQEKVMIKGEWHVHRVNTDILTLDNAMDFFLTGYQSNSECCTYIVDFKKDETVTGTFTKDNVVVQVDSGVWHLDKFNVLYVKLGKYIDGTYDVDRQKHKKYTLYTKENINPVPAISNNEFAEVTIDIERLKD